MKAKIKKSREKTLFFQLPKLAPALDLRVQSTPLLEEVDQQVDFDRLDLGREHKQVQVNNDSLSRLQMQLESLLLEKKERWQAVNQFLRKRQCQAATSNEKKLSITQRQQAVEQGRVQGLSFSLRHFVNGEKVSSQALSEFQIVDGELQGLEDQM